MPNHAVTYLSDDGALYLEIEGKRYDIAHYTASWAVNEIPQGQCMIAVGRNARSDNAGELAAIHRESQTLRQMRKAKVVFKPRGEYDPVGNVWPEGEVTVFDGYYVGYAHRKMNGKIQVIVNLTHWLIDLTQSSCLSRNSHPSNPASLTSAAVMKQLRESGGSQGAFVSYLTGHKVIETRVLEDLWGAIKELFCQTALIKTTAIGPSDICSAGSGPDKFVENARALSALARIEGVGSACAKPYKHGVVLKPAFKSQPLIASAIGNAICNATVDSYANTTFWDKLVGEFCPMFGIAVVPLVDKALVVADTPAYNRNFWRTLDPDEYDSFDQTAFVERPMRAVGVYGNVASFTGARQGQEPVNHREIGGCFAVNEPDGLVQYITAPPWLDTLASAAVIGSTSTGNKKDAPTSTSTAPGKTDKPPEVFTATLSDAQKLYSQYAQTVFALHTLRGRNGAVSGKLRFDIGPGSIVKVKSTPDVQTAPGIDKLAGDFYGCVSRVTININCEASMAGTTFQLTHLRTETENSDPRTSVQEHPLFARAIHGGGKHGAPLIDVYEDLVE